MFTESKNLIPRRQILKGAAAAAALAAIQTPNLARASEAAAAGPSLMGVWMSHVIDQTGSTRVDIMSFSTDGLVLTAGALPLVAEKPAGPRRSSIGQGTWTRAAGRAFDAHFVELNQNADGTFGGTTTIRSYVTLSADGNTAQGRSNIVVEVGGRVVFTSHATVRATRITPPAA